jgi:hypothetical protein
MRGVVDGMKKSLILRRPPFETAPAAVPDDGAAVAKDALRSSNTSRFPDISPAGMTV